MSGSQMYRMHDAAPAGVFPVDEGDAKAWNERGHGIFATVNSFDGPRRKENLAAINAWPIDIDEGTKAEQAKRLLGAPLVPSLIVETKRGYQAYWFAKEAKAEHWNALVLERLVPYFGADKNARDLCRILRVPGYLHLKDPAAPFMVRVAWRHWVRYTERQVAESFPWVPSKQAHAEGLTEARSAMIARGTAPVGGPSETLWDAVWRLDARDTLERLSGHWAVGGESYSFRQNANGKLNILVAGKGTSCFVDESGHIGSLKGGGPTPAQWLRYFGHSWKVVVDVLKEVHPHLADIDEAQRAAYRAERRAS